MGKINGCLRCLFIFFNVIFAIIGGVLIFGAVKANAFSHQLQATGSPGIAWLWVFAIGVLAISCLGIYAGFSETQIVLKVFAGFMGIGMIIMLIFGIIIVVTRNKVKAAFDSASSDLATNYMNDESLRAMLEGFQQSVQCCGVVSATDWGNDIPESCQCQQSLYGGYSDIGGDCMSKPQGASGPAQIYKQPCRDIIFFYLDLIFKTAMGFFFGFAVTALLGLLVSLLMIYQVRHYDGEGSQGMAMKGY